MKKIEITKKHVEALIGKNITVSFTISGHFKANFFGKIIGRIRNRFKQYVFVANAPFTTMEFSTDDIEKIEMPQEDVWVFTMKENKPPEKKKRRKKRRPLPVVAMEPETPPVVDVSNNVETTEYVVPVEPLPVA